MSKKKTKEQKLKELDETMSAKIISLSQKYPHMCIQFLEEMHQILDWGEAWLERIK